jgi:hypothetical protein
MTKNGKKYLVVGGAVALGVVSYVVWQRRVNNSSDGSNAKGTGDTTPNGADAYTTMPGVTNSGPVVYELAPSNQFDWQGMSGTVQTQLETIEQGLVKIQTSTAPKKA